MTYWMTIQSREFLKVDELIAEILAGRITEDGISVKSNRWQVQKGDKGFLIAKEKDEKPRGIYATFEVLESAKPMLDPNPQFLVKPEEDKELPRVIIRYDSCCLPIPMDLKMPPGTRKMCKVDRAFYEDKAGRIKQGE